VVVAAVVALVQLDAAKTGKPSLIAIAVTSTAVYAQTAVAWVTGGVRAAGAGIGDAPHLYSDNASLRTRLASLEAENGRLREALALAPDARAIAEIAARESGGISATIVGYDPENLVRTIVLDRGAEAGIARDDGVIDDAGVVGRVVAVTPATSTVLLLTDGGSKVPAVVQRGRWWGIATGTNGRVRLQYVSQDARLRVGDRIVTGAGRSFRAGIPIGRITRVDHPEGSLYQTAVVEPVVVFGRLTRVLVLPPANRAR